MLGTTGTSTSLIKADGLTTGANINILPADADTQKDKDLVTGTGAAGYAPYFHLTGLPSSDEWSLKPNAGNNGLVLRKQETIDSSNGGTWKKLKDAIAAAEDGDVIKISGEIKATNDTDNSGELIVNKNITVKKADGASTAVLNANGTAGSKPAHRIFKVASGKKLTLENLTLKGGKPDASNENGYGGGILLQGGTLDMKNCDVKGNESEGGGGIYAGKVGTAASSVTISGGTIGGTDAADKNKTGSYNSGGGIYIGEYCSLTMKDNAKVIGNETGVSGGGIFADANSTLDFDHCTVTGNKASGSGGGIHAIGALTMDHCTVDDNSTTGDSGGGVCVSGTAEIKGGSIIAHNEAKVSGGGIYAGGGTLTLVNSTVGGEQDYDGTHSTKSKGNKAASGGGIYANNSTLTMTQGSVSCNTATDSGSNVFGGGIYVGEGSTLTMQNDAKVSGNHAKTSGGGVYVKNGTATFTMKGSSCITPSSAGDANVAGKNDVYLDNDGGGNIAKISLPEVLSGTAPVVARITIADDKYLSTTQVLDGAAVGTEYSKFTVTPKTVSGGTQIWTINNTGHLQKPPVEINGTDSLAWKKLKDAVAAADDGDVIKIIGEIKATNATDNSGELEISKNLTIKGEGAAAALNANSNHSGPVPADAPATKHRIFKVASGKTLTLKNLTLKGGQNTTGAFGGAITVTGSSTAELSDCVIEDCQANKGGAIGCYSGTTVTLTNTTIQKCKATERGGAIYASGATVTLTGCTLTGNEAVLKGGAIYAVKAGISPTTPSAVTISGGTIGGTNPTDANKATGTGTDNGMGGGIYVGETCTLTLKDSAKVIGNTAKYGGGVYASGGSLVMTSSTIEKCQATQEGGGIFAKGGSVELNSCTIKGNKGTLAGGGICARLNDSTPARVTINGGVIGGTSVSEANTTTGSTGKGGGIFVSGANSAVTLSGTANVIGNTTEHEGGGIFVDTGSVLNMKGSAIVTPSTGGDANAPRKNDVYLMDGCTIKLSETLSGADPVARITPATYNTTTQVLTGGAVGTEHVKFTVTPKTVSGVKQEWTIKNDGYLQKSPVTINGSDTDAWTKLKTEVEKTGGGAAKITIQGTILAKPAHKGEITVSREVEIEGNGTDAVLDAQLNNRIFKIEAAGKLTIKNLKLTGGLSNGAALQSENYGGAIYNEGELTVISCEMRDNFAEHSGGGAIYVKHGGKCTIKGTGARKTIIAKNEASKGGGIQIDGECTVDEYTVIGGSAGDANKGKQYAGGILVASTGKCTIKGGVEISYNTLTETSGTKGGGIFVEDFSGNKGELILEGSAGKTVTIKENKATKGAGIYCEGTIPSMKHTEIKNCIASQNVGGIYLANNASVKMGDNAEITDCSTENANYGGGVYVDSDTCTFEMTGSAKVTVSTGADKNKEGANEIFLKYGVIKVTGTLTAGNGQAGRISVLSSNYQTSTKVLTGDNLPTNSGKFTVTKQKGLNQAWKVSPSGTLQKN